MEQVGPEARGALEQEGEREGGTINTLSYLVSQSWQRDQDLLSQALLHIPRQSLIYFNPRLIGLPPSQNPQEACILVLGWLSGFRCIIFPWCLLSPSLWLNLPFFSLLPLLLVEVPLYSLFCPAPSWFSFLLYFYEQGREYMVSAAYIAWDKRFLT